MAGREAWRGVEKVPNIVKMFPDTNSSTGERVRKSSTSTDPLFFFTVSSFTNLTPNLPKVCRINENLNNGRKKIKTIILSCAE